MSTVVAADTRTGRIAHRADPDGLPACSATSTSRWHSMSAGRAYAAGDEPCRERACFPAGYDLADVTGPAPLARVGAWIRDTAPFGRAA